MLTLPILTLPSYSSASSSSTGAIILHGPHHSAQKSTSTGVADWRTSLSKLSCVSAEINGEAIGCSGCGKTVVRSLNQGFTASFSIFHIQPVVPAAAKPATPAAMASILSSGLMAEAAAAGFGAERCCADGAAAGAAAGERWAAGVADERKAVEPGGVGASGEPPAAPVGPPGGSVGSLMVGA